MDQNRPNSTAAEVAEQMQERIRCSVDDVVAATLKIFPAGTDPDALHSVVMLGASIGSAITVETLKGDVNHTLRAAIAEAVQPVEVAS